MVLIFLSHGNAKLVLDYLIDESDFTNICRCNEYMLCILDPDSWTNLFGPFFGNLGNYTGCVNSLYKQYIQYKCFWCHVMQFALCDVLPRRQRLTFRRFMPWKSLDFPEKTYIGVDGLSSTVSIPVLITAAATKKKIWLIGRTTLLNSLNSSFDGPNKESLIFWRSKRIISNFIISEYCA